MALACARWRSLPAITRPGRRATGTGGALRRLRLLWLGRCGAGALWPRIRYGHRAASVVVAVGSHCDGLLPSLARPQGARSDS